MQPGNVSDTRAGIAGGTVLPLFPLFASIHSVDVLKTITLACVGAVVSFGMSMLLKWVTRKWRGRGS